MVRKLTIIALLFFFTFSFQYICEKKSFPFTGGQLTLYERYISSFSLSEALHFLNFVETELNNFNLLVINNPRMRNSQNLIKENKFCLEVKKRLNTRIEHLKSFYNPPKKSQNYEDIYFNYQ